MTNQTSDSKRIHVAVAVIQDAQGNILVSRRLQHVHQGGLWEFPGGKTESGESIYQALQRELMEELAVKINAAYPLITIEHEYDDRSVLLDVWIVTDYSGEPQSCEGQEFKWVSKGELASLDMPAADVPIVQAVNLPDCYVITPEPQWLIDAFQASSCNDRDKAIKRFMVEFEQTLSNDVRLVQLRLKNIDIDTRNLIVTSCLEIANKYDCQLMLNSTLEQALVLGAHGIHLDGFQLQTLTNGKDIKRLIKEVNPVNESQRTLTGLEKTSEINTANQSTAPVSLLVSASCHNEQQLQMAQQLGVDFVVLSPVKETNSHPGTKGMGWEKFQTLVETCNLPVYALGGMNLSDLSQARERGAQGIAAISEFWVSEKC